MATLELDWSAHPQPRDLVRQLREAGYEAWLAGGCVRDLLLGRTPKDFDVATSATPDQVRTVFRRTVAVKPELGVTLVLIGQERIETTTFRTEGAYLDGRRPSSVGPATAAQDVQRRDFTVNGLLLDPLTGEIADHVGGLEDLRAGVLRCIRDPDERFEEDHLRILRAVRFSVRFGFQIEERTWNAMVRRAAHVSQLSGERIREEFSRMFEGPFSRCLSLLLDSGALAAISPALARALEDPGIRSRTEALCEKAIPPVPGLWIALAGLPLCRWFDPSAGPQAEAAQDALLERLRAARTEADAAHLSWSGWPDLLSPLARPSQLAPMLRSRHWPVLRALMGILDPEETKLPLRELDRLREAIPPAPPALGVAFQQAGVPKGPLLGDAIREADRRILDEGRIAGPDLVRDVAEAILGAE